ncbi:MAG TPA: efflux transporter outer membrane subunit [Rhizomicrobium sp.]|jgi:NodT family efflux transporter outer membrane factor (OMF) lipoprotein|nr:efflux transporter outer membrane subunit [Rhizomicrobium sp.]
MARKLLLLGLCLGVAACTVGPDFQAPPPPKAESYTGAPLTDTVGVTVAGGAAQHFAPGADIPGQWWLLFHSEALDGLVRQAIKDSPNLQAAQAALRAAMENVKAQMGNYYPSVTAGLDASRNRNAAQISPTLTSAALLYSLYQTQLSVSWSPDLWGGNRRQVEALQAEADSQRFQLQAAYVGLTANIVAAAIQEASLRAQIDATHALIADEQQILEIEEHQHSLGQIAGADIAAQQVVLAQMQQTLPPLEKQLAQNRDLLIALGGHLPADDAPPDLDLAALKLPEDIPVSLPSKLVEQRPDVRAAEENLHMASAEIGVSIAARLPNITLSADAGTVATELGQLSAPGNQFWSIGAGLTQPLFDGGTLAHRTQAARDTYDQVAAQYRGTVVTAFQNVADALHAVQSDSDNLNAAEAADAAASRSLAIARKLVSLGQTSGLGLLTAEQAQQQTRLAVIQAQASRLSDTAALFAALGGGWWNQPDVEVHLAKP